MIKYRWRGWESMKKKEMSKTSLLIQDYTRYSFVLMSLSLFLYIGSFMPTVEPKNGLILQVISYTSVIAAFYFYRKVSKLKNQSEEDQDINF
jgi:hypothetical protein